jgi:hypothetical protein
MVPCSLWGAWTWPMTVIFCVYVWLWCKTTVKVYPMVESRTHLWLDVCDFDIKRTICMYKIEEWQRVCRCSCQDTSRLEGVPLSVKHNLRVSARSKREKTWIFYPMYLNGIDTLDRRTPRCLAGWAVFNGPNTPTPNQPYPQSCKPQPLAVRRNATVI